MKILILSCFTGEGHNSAAKAVAQVFEASGCDCVVADPVAFGGERAKNFVSSLYNHTIQKRPRAFGLVYKVGAFYCSSRLPSPVYYANASYSSNLYQYIVENQFDAVVCSHLYGMEAMTAIRKRHPDSVPCFGILTDYTCIPFMGDTQLDLYFSPHKTVSQELMHAGIPAKRIVDTGIPVSPKFRTALDKTAARKQLHLPPEKKIFLIMTGGIGCDNMLGLCHEVMSRNQEQIMTYVLTGHNDELRQRVADVYQNARNITAVGFTDKVHLYMKAADVLLSKPGGLSSTEAAVANIPFVCVNAIPGCESKNASFYSKNGLAMHAATNQAAVDYALLLAFDEKKAAAMRQKQRDFINAHAAEDIVEKVMNYEKQ